MCVHLAVRSSPASTPTTLTTAKIQLKREWSLLAIFGRANRSYHDISNTWLAHGFLSSSPTCPARQCGLCARGADDLPFHFVEAFVNGVDEISGRRRDWYGGRRS